jgi:hypothetical protein
MVKTYLREFMNHPDAERTQTEPVIRYIEEREDENLSHWDIVFVGSSDRNASASGHLPIDLSLQERTPAIKEDGKVVATSRRFSSRGVVRLGMDDVAIGRVKATAEVEGTKNIADSAYLAERERPLLAVHFLKLIDKESNKVTDEPPLTAWTIGFPNSRRANQTVSYRVNTVWWQQNSTDIDEEVAEALDREE